MHDIHATARVRVLVCAERRRARLRALVFVLAHAAPLLARARRRRSWREVSVGTNAPTQGAAAFRGGLSFRRQPLPPPR